MTNDSPARIEAPWIAADINPDNLKSSHWQSATPVEINRRWSGEAAPADHHAEARILWTDYALCVRFVGRQTGPPVVNAQPRFDTKTIGLWHRDVCEIFIAPDPDIPSRYFEFEAAPSGEWVDLGIRFQEEKRETDFDFRSGMTVAASIAANQLMIAIRIPWSNSIPKPEKGERWRINLFRCIGAGNERYLAWQPSFTAEPNFHVPEVFGWLEFV